MKGTTFATEQEVPQYINFKCEWAYWTDSGKPGMLGMRRATERLRSHPKTEHSEGTCATLFPWQRSLGEDPRRCACFPLVPRRR